MFLSPGSEDACSLGGVVAVSKLWQTRPYLVMGRVWVSSGRVDFAALGRKQASRWSQEKGVRAICDRKYPGIFSSPPAMLPSLQC